MIINILPKTLERIVTLFTGKPAGEETGKGDH
jgi:hypothetical protein